MNKKNLIYTLATGLFLFGSYQAFAFNLPSDKELIEKCEQFVLKQRVTIEEREELVHQCALDLKEQYSLSNEDNSNYMQQDEFKTNLPLIAL
jgi:hypothetical protein